MYLVTYVYVGSTACLLPVGSVWGELNTSDVGSSPGTNPVVIDNRNMLRMLPDYRNIFLWFAIAFWIGSKELTNLVKYC